MMIKLSKEIEFNGKAYHELNLDLDKLTGNDLIEAEESLRSKGLVTGAGDYSRNYILAVASRATGVPSEALKYMSAKDFTAMINETLVFLAVSDSDSVPESEPRKVSQKKS